MGAKKELSLRQTVFVGLAGILGLAIAAFNLPIWTFLPMIIICGALGGDGPQWFRKHTRRDD